MASTGPTSELQSVISLVKTLTNAQMKEILRSEGLVIGGVKSALQLRIIEYLERLYQGGPVDRYDRLRKNIYSQTHRSLPITPTSHPSHSQTHHHPSTTQNRQSLGSAMSTQPFSTGRLTFKSSPFYTIVEPLTPTVECKVREQTRDNVELKVVLSGSVAARLQVDSNLRVMVYCAADTGLNQFSRSDITFPHQVELKVNLDEVKANLRGLKNKPGTTRPADITNYIRKRSGYPNQIILTYALTQKRFFVLVNLVQKHPIGDLVTELKARQTIPKEQVLREMRSRAEDADIVATSTVMSLKCPLSTLRIEVPCRSMVCTHNQCFDASSFLELQEQAPTWTCPVCSKATSYESLQIDQYVDEILRSNSSDVDQVTIEPNGEWYSNKNEEPPGRDGVGSSPDDDLIEIRPSNSPFLKQEPGLEQTTLQQTPRTQERSAISSGVRQSGSKRPAPQVIDLTGSDNDTPSRPAKRRALDVTDTYPSQRGSQNSFRDSFSGTSIHLSSSDSSLSPGQSTSFYDV